MKTKTQTIEVKGLPEGFEVKSLKIHVPPETLMQITKNNHHYNLTIDLARANADVVLQKIQPRRISFDEITDGTQDIEADYFIKYKWWREVKETEEPKLSLTKKDMLELIEHIKLGGQLNPKIAEFIKENS